MPEPVRALPNDVDLARLSRIVMRRQAGLSLRVASVFVVLILGLPLVNRFLPEVANYPIYGFPASWLFLGVIFYPITVALSVYFVRRSDRIEAECKDWDTLGESGARP
ncbi:MAG: putative integral rane protein [Planctomycetota bacterium]|nr:putative integral rane protein [Planctomycetota bacterium]